jgi:translation initiation factor RLI1
MTEESGDISTADVAREYATQELTKYSVEMFEYYTRHLSKSEALGVVIEALSESLGNMISLVSDSNQLEVLDTANLVIQQGILNQCKRVAELSYGQVGHA